MPTVRNRIAGFSVFVACALLLRLCLQSPTEAMAAWGKPLADYSGQATPGITVSGDTARVYDLTITKGLGEDFDEGQTVYSVVYAGKEVATGYTADIMESFPKAGMTTVLITSFSGGATGCCYEYSFFTINLADNSVLLTTLEAGGRRGMHDDGFFEADGRIRFGHWDFDGYSLTKNGVSMSICHATAPWLDRFLVFENGQWRADRVGEFPEYYKSQLSRPAAKTGDRPDPATLALETAYYSLMAQISPQETVDAVAKVLGSKKAVLAKGVVADEQKDIAGNAFVQNSLLSSISPPAPAPLVQTAGEESRFAGPDTAKPTPPADNATGGDIGPQCAQNVENPCERAACQGNCLKYWDDALNARFKVLMQNYPETRRAALKKEEIQWVKEYMRLQASLQDKKTGTCADQTVYQSAMADFVKKRVLILLGMPDS